MNACTLLSNFTREEYKGGLEPGLVLGGGWHLLFLPLNRTTGQENTSQLLDNKGYPPLIFSRVKSYTSSSEGPLLWVPHPRSPLIFQTPPLSGTQRLYLPQAVDNPPGVSQAYWIIFDVVLPAFFIFRYFIIFNDLYSFVWGRQYCKNLYLIKILYD